MKNNLAFIQDGLATHPAEALFIVSVKNYKRSSMEFNFTVRDKLLNSFCDSPGVCNLLIDYAARKAGFEVIGCCFVHELETSTHCRIVAKGFTVKVNIESHNLLDASYSCEVYSRTASDEIVIAESHGTLVKYDF